MARSVALRLKNHSVIEVRDVDKIAKLVNDAVTNTRDLSRGLHRADIDAPGFIDALRDLVDRKIWKIPCQLEVDPSFHIEDDTAASQLYLIAREAVINANKHAQGRGIVVEMRCWQNGIVVSVTDDGVGFQKEPKSAPGLGLPIMKYRAHSIGGRSGNRIFKKGRLPCRLFFARSPAKIAQDRKYSVKPIACENHQSITNPPRLLQITLDEGSEMNELLNGLAESIVNPETQKELTSTAPNR